MFKTLKSFIYVSAVKQVNRKVKSKKEGKGIHTEKELRPEQELCVSRPKTLSS